MKSPQPLPGKQPLSRALSGKTHSVRDAPLVSIIISTYNSREWLAEAIDSALAQTYPNCEVVVVDNGSTDGTSSWLAETYDTKIRHSQKKHGGLGSGRNFGLNQAKGEYIQFLDADDLLSPDKVLLHVEYLESHSDVDIVFSHCQLFLDGRREELFDWERSGHYQAKDFFQEMFGEGFLLIHMPLSRRTTLAKAGGFDENLGAGTDWDFWLRVARTGAKFSYFPGEATSYYRVRPRSMSKSLSNMSDNLRVLDKVAGYVTDADERRRIEFSRVRGLWWFRYGRMLSETGEILRGLWWMIKGSIAERRNLRYKSLYMVLSLMLGAGRAGRVVARLDRTKGTRATPLLRKGDIV